MRLSFEEFLQLGIILGRAGPLRGMGLKYGKSTFQVAATLEIKAEGGQSVRRKAMRCKTFMKFRDQFELRSPLLRRSVGQNQEQIEGFELAVEPDLLLAARQIESAFCCEVSRHEAKPVHIQLIADGGDVC